VFLIDFLWHSGCISPYDGAKEQPALMFRIDLYEQQDEATMQIEGHFTGGLEDGFD